MLKKCTSSLKYVNIHLKGRSKAGLLMMLVIRIKANFPFKNKRGIVKNRIRRLGTRKSDNILFAMLILVFSFIRKDSFFISKLFTFES